VRGALLAALGDPRNWRAEAPEPRQSLVTLRGGLPTNEILLHPLGRLAVSQQVVPLGLSIDRFGNARPSGPNRFSIDRASVGGTDVSTSPLNDQFARAQFFDMSDEEKLTSPPFETMPAGVEVGASTLGHGPGVEVSTDYETRIYDAATGGSTAGDSYNVTASRLAVLAQLGAAGVSGVARAGGAKYRGAARPVRVGWTRYQVASTDDLSAKAIDGAPAGGARTYTEAVSALRSHTAAHPEQHGKLQVVEIHG
jgi:hypothetical protein